MYDEHQDLDNDLVWLAHALRDGDLMASCLQLAEFALKLDHLMRSEERALTLAFERLGATRPSTLAMVRTEHASLRRLVSQVAGALDRADDRRGLELITKLRSVLLVHVAKEESLRGLLHAPA